MTARIYLIYSLISFREDFVDKHHFQFSCHLDLTLNISPRYTTGSAAGEIMVVTPLLTPIDGGLDPNDGKDDFSIRPACALKTHQEGGGNLQVLGRKRGRGESTLVINEELGQGGGPEIKRRREGETIVLVEVVDVEVLI